MKVAVFSESRADEVAIRILVDGVLSGATDSPTMPRLRATGWPSVLENLRPVILDLHGKADTDALVVVADSNGTEIHARHHEVPDQPVEGCRLCQLRDRVCSVMSSLSPRPDRGPLKVAVGLAVPCIEAWYLCGKDPGVGEAMWRTDSVRQKSRGFRNDLKRRVYGMDRTSGEMKLRRAVEEVRRLAARIDLLETKFPDGFGHLARQIRSW